MLRDDHKIGIAGGLLMAGLVLVASIAVYGVMRLQIESSLGRGLEVALQSNARLFKSQIDEGLMNTRAVVTRPFLIQTLQQLNAQPGSASALHNMRRNIDSLPAAGFENRSGSTAEGLRRRRGLRHLP